jgi:hypothetical protein
MERHTEIINNREYTMGKAAPFAGNALLLKLKKNIAPAMIDVLSGGVTMDSDASKMITAISELVDEKTLSEFVFPMFALSQVASIEDNCKIDSKTMDKVFTMDTLADFYELIWLVFKYNYWAFFLELKNKMSGLNLGAPQSPESITAK